LVSTGTGADDTDPDTVVISVSAPYRIGLPAKELYSDDKIMDKYETVIYDVFSSMWPSTDKEIAKNASHALVRFEKDLAAISPDAEDRDDVTVGFSL
jgi:endothelin-converting enzyme